MSSLTQIIKINNSYESDPSSGSGSSLSENNEYHHVSDDENMNLPYLLKPKTFIGEDTASPTVANATLQKFQHSSKADVVEQERISRYGIPLHSSQESSFEGFNDSPFGKVQRQLYPQQQITETPVEKCQLPLLLPQELQLSSGKVLVDKFYDTIIEENSCNAVYMQLSEESASQCSPNGCSASNNKGKPSSELSFNGRIQGLTLTAKSAAPIEVLSSVETASLPTSGLPLEIAQTQHTSKFTKSFVLKLYNNERSPDLFGEDEDDDNDGDGDGDIDIAITVVESGENELQAEKRVEHPQSYSNINKSFTCGTECSFTDEPTLDTTTQMTEETLSCYNDNFHRERELLRRIRKCLAGVPPPPSLTIPQLDMFHAVLSRKDEILNFFSTSLTRNSERSSCSTTCSLFKPTHSLDEAKNMPWQEIRGVRQHGLCFNLSSASESNEYLSLSVIERFIGAETASSYRNSPSSAKKRNTRLKLLTQSPGSRLSHLAKRRAVFSSAHLATTSQKCNSLLGPQIMFDKQKGKHRRKGTPKRKTPGSKRKNRKTPTSSARKRLFRTDVVKPGPSREASKRALFQSPAKQQLVQKHITASLKPVIKPEIAIRVEKSKRALFSPDHQSQSSHASSSLFSFSLGSEKEPNGRLESLLKRKRNSDDEDTDVELARQSSKLFHSSSNNETLTPRALKIKSQSFCIGAGSSSTVFAAGTATTTIKATTSSGDMISSSAQLYPGGSGAGMFGAKMQRAHSDMVAPTNSLTENQRKKLLWAVSQALQEKKISAKHDNFKQYASVLARVVRRIFQEYYQKSSTSNSETMLRLSKKYMFKVISGRNADDIYFEAKAQIEEAKRLSSSRISGYIAPEEYQQRQLLVAQLQSSYMGSCQNLCMENSIDSFSTCISSQASSAALSVTASQTSFLGYISQNSNNTQTKSATKQTHPQLPVLPNPTLENSSSKNNLGGVALRENVDCEQRRSAQKNFTGKDQRNVSPYAAGRANSGIKLQTAHFGELTVPCGAKAKRQITFDS